jgi:two-component system, NtrC family, sensor kinase
MQSHRLSLIIGIALMGALGAIYAIASTILLSSFDQVEQHQVQGDVARATDAINNELKLLANKVLDYATWDDNYQFVQGKNPDFCETGITDSTFASSNMNFAAIARSTGQILCSRGFDPIQKRSIPFVGSLQSYLTATDLLLKNSYPKSQHQGFLKLPEGLLMIASSPVLTSEGEGPILGSMIAGQYFDTVRVKNLTQSTRLSLTVQPIDDLHLSADFQTARLALSQKNTTFISPLNQDFIAGYTLLKDIYGKPVALLRVKTPRTVYQQGILSLKYLGFSLLLLGGAAGGVIWRLLDRIVASLRERDRLEQSLLQEATLRQSEAKYRIKAEELEHTLQALQQAQAHLIQSEKMSSLGQLVAGIAHEINNPVNFIHGNVTYLKRHVQDLMKLVHLYQKHYPIPDLEIQIQVVRLDTDFLLTDLPLILSSIQAGSERIREIVLSLRNFSRLDESEMKFVDIHEGIDSTLLILQNRLNGNRYRPEIYVLKEYGDLPQVECYPGQLNQVLMNLLVNAIDAINELWEDQGRALRDTRKGSLQDANGSPTIQVNTQVLSQWQVAIHITDNGKGISETIQKKLFDPFFTTKPVGTGTGMGLAISYQIVVEKHQGQLWCSSTLGQGAKFVVQIPIQQSKCQQQHLSDKENLSASPLFCNH